MSPPRYQKKYVRVPYRRYRRADPNFEDNLLQLYHDLHAYQYAVGIDKVKFDEHHPKTVADVAKRMNMVRNTVDSRYALYCAARDEGQIDGDFPGVHDLRGQHSRAFTVEEEAAFASFIKAVYIDTKKMIQRADV